MTQFSNQNKSNPYAPITLNTTEFPKELENEFNVLPTYDPQCDKEKVLAGEKDKRYVYDTSKLNFYSRIGQIRSSFENLVNDEGKDILYSGTATVFYTDVISGRVYAITCAHNLVHYDHPEQTTHKLKELWFDRRTTTNYRFSISTSSIEKYKVDQYWIHPQNSAEKKINPYDLGIISFKDNDYYFRSLCSNEPFSEVMNQGNYTSYDWLASKWYFNAFVSIVQAILVWMLSFVAVLGGVAYVLSVLFCPVKVLKGSHISLFGYPAEKKGELWGEHTSDPYIKALEKRKNGMIRYKIHTSGGQSGSAIIYSQYNEHKIVGIHTNGGLTKNYGVKMSQNNIEWVKNIIESNGAHMKNDTSWDDQLCQIFKDLDLS